MREQCLRHPHARHAHRRHLPARQIRSPAHLVASRADTQRLDVAVVGLGLIGAAALRHLANNGLRCVGVRIESSLDPPVRTPGQENEPEPRSSPPSSSLLIHPLNVLIHEIIHKSNNNTLQLFNIDILLYKALSFFALSSGS